MRIYTPPPRSPDAPEALKALDAVPGPSPWYLARTAAEVQRGEETLPWRAAGQKTPAAGKSLLTTPSGDALAVADFNCYVQLLRGEQLLVWSAEDEGNVGLLKSWMRFRLLDLQQLRPITDPAASFTKLGRHSRFYVDSGEVATFALSTALADGVHTIELPAEFTGIGELLVLAQSTADGPRQNGDDEMHVRLWIIDSGRRQLEIIPQDWFNEGSYDFGYRRESSISRDGSRVSRNESSPHALLF